MAASQNRDDIGVRSFTVPGFTRGINSALPATAINDQEAQDILNMEWDEGNNLSSRSGFASFLSTTFANRITSLHYFTAESGEVGILYTTGALLKKIATNGTGDTNITGALTLPNDTFWQWTTFEGLAVGCNKATSGDNPVKVDNTGTAAALGGTPPKAKYCTVWNQRLWLVSATNPNQIWGSKLGNAEVWATGTLATDAINLAIDENDGDLITGIHATKEALYVFKRRRIFKVTVKSNLVSSDDQTNLKVVVVTQNIGCVSAYSIRQVLNDVFFLSDQGEAALSLVETAQDYKAALLSYRVAEIMKTPKAVTDEIPAFTFDTASQYWLSFPATISLTGLPLAYVADYLKVNEQDEQGRPLIRWTRFDGLAAFTAATSFPGGLSGKTYIVGAKNAGGTFKLYSYQPRTQINAYADDGVAYVKSLKTKSFSIDLPLLRKWWKKWGCAFGLLTNTAQVSIQYFFDRNLNRSATYSFNLTGPGTGALWDFALWDVASWDTAIVVPIDIVRRFVAADVGSGQKSQDVAFIISNGQANQGITVRSFILFYSLLSERLVADA